MCQSSNLQTGRGHEMGCLPSDYFFLFQAEQAVLQLVSLRFNFLSQNYHRDVDMEV